MAAYKFCEAERRVTLPNKISIHLSPIESHLFAVLSKSIDRTVSRDEIETNVWGEYISHRSRTLDAHISRLRTKLSLDGTHGLWLRALYTTGYRLERV